MGRGQMSGGGASQLSYLFGSDSSDSQAPVNSSISKGGRGRVAPVSEAAPAHTPPPPAAPAHAAKEEASHHTADTNSLAMGGGSNQSRANMNNYHRADGQNVNNFLTDRPSTRVVAAPGGNSQLNFLFGG